MTKTAKSILRNLSNTVEWCVEPQLLLRATIDRQREQAALDQALKELESIMQTLVIDYENPLLAGHLSIHREIERNLLRAEQRQALQTALYGKEAEL